MSQYNIIRDKVLNDIKELNQCKNSRVKLEKEFEESTQTTVTNFKANLTALDNQLWKKSESIVSSKYIKRICVEDHEYKGYCFTVDEFYLFGDKIAKYSKSYTTWGDTRNERYEFYPIDLQKINIEEVKEKLLELLNKENEVKISEANKKTEEVKKLDHEINKNNENLNSLRVEQSLLPWYAFSKKAKIKKNIKEYEAKVNGLEIKKEFAEADIEKAKHKDDIETELDNIKKIAEEINSHVVNMGKLDKLTQKMKTYDSSFEKIISHENAIITSYLNNIDKVNELKKISKGSNIDKETKEMANKLLKFISNKITEKNKKKR